MAKFIRNNQLITSYDVITPSQVVLGHISPERVVSAQPAGYGATLSKDGTVWTLADQSRGNVIAECASLKEVKKTIADNHNFYEQHTFRAAAVAWVDYYNNPHNAVEKRRANPQLLESIYACAARARLHPDDTPVVGSTSTPKVEYHITGA